MILRKTRYFFIYFLSNLLILGGATLIGYTYLPIVASEAWYYLKTYKKQEYSLTANAGQPRSVFAKYLSSDPVKLIPVNRDFSIVIEKIGVIAPIVRGVSVRDENAYIESLKSGVAHAAGSALPGERGNVYLFAHSSINFFRLGKYASVFTLLRKVEAGDKVHVFYEDKDYTYVVIAKEVLKGWNTTPLTRISIEPILTLQTCDPPGTTINRLVVTAKLVSVK
ncbi:sortase [candidate division WWE3 bacterium]|nr:sortase [candidate division WWE3 bacterium]